MSECGCAERGGCVGTCDWARSGQYAVSAAEARLRERLAHDIAALTIPLFEQGSSARIVLLDDVLAVVRGVGEAKP